MRDFPKEYVERALGERRTDGDCYRHVYLRRCRVGINRISHLAGCHRRKHVLKEINTLHARACVCVRCVGCILCCASELIIAAFCGSRTTNDDDEGNGYDDDGHGERDTHSRTAANGRERTKP